MNRNNETMRQGDDRAMPRHDKVMDHAIKRQDNNQSDDNEKRL